MGSVFGIQLAQDILDMNRNCPLTDKQALCDAAILFASDNEAQNLALLLCESEVDYGSDGGGFVRVLGGRQGQLKCVGASRFDRFEIPAIPGKLILLG